MYTLAVEMFKKLAVFVEGSWYILPPGATSNITTMGGVYDTVPTTRVMHSCSNMKALRPSTPIAFLYMSGDPNTFECDSCHTKAPDSIITILSLMEA